MSSYEQILAKIASGNVTDTLILIEKIKNFKYPDEQSVPSIANTEAETLTEMDFIQKNVNPGVFPPSRLVPILNFIKNRPDLVGQLWT
jgi:hypothetical protein